MCYWGFHLKSCKNYLHGSWLFILSLENFIFVIRGVNKSPVIKLNAMHLQDLIPRLFSPACFHSLGGRTNLEFARRWMEPRFIRLHTLWSFRYEHSGPSKECSWHSLTEEPDIWLPRWQLCCFCRVLNRAGDPHCTGAISRWPGSLENILDISWLSRNYAWDRMVNSSLMWYRTKLSEGSFKDENQVLILFLI